MKKFLILLIGGVLLVGMGMYGMSANQYLHGIWKDMMPHAAFIVSFVGFASVAWSFYLGYKVISKTEKEREQGKK